MSLDDCQVTASTFLKDGKKAGQAKLHNQMPVLLLLLLVACCLFLVCFIREHLEQDTFSLHLLHFSPITFL